jgi:hypothetical protein
MSKLRWMVAALAAAATTVSTGVASAATGVARQDDHSPVIGRVEGDTYVLLGPSVFGVTVQQDPLAYEAAVLADGTVRGHWRYDYWQGGNRAWVGGPITESSDPTQVGMGAWWQVADNGAGRHPVIPDRTTFVGIGTMAQTLAYCADEPAPHFIFDVQLGGVQVEDPGSTG